MAGTLPAGSPCAFGLQCAEGLTCSATGAELCGICVAIAGAGAPCGSGCYEGLACIDGKCARERGAGETCERDTDCVRPLRCAQSQAAGPRLCVPEHREGEACADPLDCAPELSCDSGVCRKRPPPKAPGAACTTLLDCRDFSCVNGQCTALGRAGDACGQRQCGASYICHQGLCQLPDAARCR